MSGLIDALNATGNAVLSVFFFVPEEAVILGAVVFLVWTWWQNVKAWLRAMAKKRRARLCQPCEATEEPNGTVGTVGTVDVESLKKD
tara:strand:- start:1287 stop:1547 length:261 start_codon:yes stop_codon:yes gene_type:complete